MIKLLKITFAEWYKDRAWLYAASLSFYALFAIAPMLILITLVAGIVFGKSAIEGEIVGQIQSFVGSDVASAIQIIVENARLSTSSIVFTAVGLLIFLFGASRVFTQIKFALNKVWDYKHHPGKQAHKMIKSRFTSVLLVFVFGLLLIMSIFFTAALATLGVYLANFVPLNLYVFQALNLGVSLILMTVVFALIFKYLPDVKISWNDVWIGAGFTAVLFMAGNILIGIYLRNVTGESVYGAVGSVIIVLLWLYYSAQIFFFGAEFTNVYAKEYGSYSSLIKKWFNVLNPFKK
jgi:membrane protein